MKLFSSTINDLASFYKAFRNTRREMIISSVMLVVITFILAAIFYRVEHRAQPEVFKDWWSGVVWAYSRYIEGGDGVFDGGPVTILGRTIAFMLGLIGIAIVAIPAGIIGSGFLDAIADEKRGKELEKYRKKIINSFKILESRTLKLWIDKNLPAEEGAWYHDVKFKYIANNISLSKLELKGMVLKDVLEVCEKHREFRVKNEASAQSKDEGRTDRYLLEYFPVNRPYGFFTDRGSKVTIVSTSSVTELGTGNFSYYLAKFAGFNYISKDFDIDPENRESFYNNRWAEPRVDDMTLEERKAAGEKVNKRLRTIYAKKKELRAAFLSDLESICKDEDHWVICILTQIQGQTNPVDIHIAHARAEGKDSLIHDQETYQELLRTLTSTMQEQFDLTVEETKRFPLVYNKSNGYCNIGYKLRNDGCRCNCMTMRVSSHLMHFDTRMRLAQFIMAKTIHDALTPDGRIPQADIDDMNRPSGRGFSKNEQKVDGTKIFKLED